ncbi:MAG: ATP-binding protein [Candidatus Competibacterales bacterium]
MLGRRRPTAPPRSGGDGAPPKRREDDIQQPRAAKGWTWQPRSMRGLILLSFGLVALPLVIAVVLGVLTVNRQAQRNEALVVRGTELARQSERLNDLLITLERLARQYQILGDPPILTLYEEQQGAFQEVLDQLFQLAAVAELIEHVRLIAHTISALNTLLQDQAPDEPSPATPGDAAALERHFDKLAVAVEQLMGASYRVVEAELDGFRSEAQVARRILIWQAITAIPVAVVLIVLLVPSIERPVRHLGQAIRGLGHHDLDKPIAVRGPREFRELGRELDWLRRRLDDLEQQKSRFLRHMSHELKTPLASLREGADLLLEGAAGPLNAEQRQIAGILRQSGLALQRHIENLLDFAAWQTDQSTLKRETFDLGTLLEELLTQHRLSLQTHRLDVVRRGTWRLPLCADRGKVRTALDNLLSNAIKFSPPDTAVELVASVRHQTLYCDVIDRGPGVSATERHRVFDPFYQGSTPSSGPLGGTGIGLAVARECARAHGGDITLVDSESGANFRLEIPL